MGPRQEELDEAELAQQLKARPIEAPEQIDRAGTIRHAGRGPADAPPPLLAQNRDLHPFHINFRIMGCKDCGGFRCSNSFLWGDALKYGVYSHAG